MMLFLMPALMECRKQYSSTTSAGSRVSSLNTNGANVLLSIWIGCEKTMFLYRLVAFPHVFKEPWPNGGLQIRFINVSMVSTGKPCFEANEYKIWEGESPSNIINGNADCPCCTLVSYNMGRSRVHTILNTEPGGMPWLLHTSRRMAFLQMCWLYVGDSTGSVSDGTTVFC